jgi:nicotinate phosphoribosyltransferase
MIYDEIGGIDPRGIIVDAKDPTRRKKLMNNSRATDLLIPTLRSGKIVASAEGLANIRERMQRDLKSLHPTTQRLMNTHEYPVGLDIGLHERRSALINRARHAELEGAS